MADLSIFGYDIASVDPGLGDNWFSTLVNGGVSAYTANQQAAAAAAMAPAIAQANAAAQQREQQARLDAMTLSNSSQQKYVMWGMGLLAIMFIIRATDRG